MPAKYCCIERERVERRSGRDELTGSLAADFTSLSLCLSHYCLMISEEREKGDGKRKEHKNCFLLNTLN